MHCVKFMYSSCEIGLFPEVVVEGDILYSESVTAAIDEKVTMYRKQLSKWK